MLALIPVSFVSCADFTLGFCVLVPFIFPTTSKTKNKRNNISAPIDKSLMFPLIVNYDADIHDALASLRILDGTIPRHAQHGAPVNFSAPARNQAVKYDG
jgi:hypothetical protein